MRAGVAAAAAALGLGLAGCAAPGTVPPGPTPVRTPLAGPPAAPGLPSFQAVAARGRLAYLSLCVDCHGPEGRGDGPAAALLRRRPADFTDPVLARTARPTWYYRAITEGVTGSAMGSWDHRLDEGGRWDVAFYVWSLAAPPGRLAAGEALYGLHCLACHGRAGEGPPEAPLNAADRARLSRAETVTGLRAAHPDLVAGLDEAAVEALAEWLGSFLYQPPTPGGHP